MSPLERRGGSPHRDADARAVSTVFDVALCLLLVSASVLTLADTPLADSEGDFRDAADAADETAETLATSTARVSYRAGGRNPTVADRNRTARARNRTVHATLAGLLVSAARAEVLLQDDSSERVNTDSTAAFVAAVTETVGRTLRRADVGVQVVAHSTAGNGSRRGTISPGGRGESGDGRDGSGDSRDESADGRVVAGETPPPNADVHAAAFAVRRVELTVRTWDR